MNFDGVNDWINLAAGGTLNCLDGVTAASMMAWLDFDVTNGNTMMAWSITSGVPTNASRMVMDRDAAGVILNGARAPDADPLITIADPAGAPPINTEQFVVIGVNVPGDNGTIYRNGALQLSAAMAFAGAAFSVGVSISASLMAQDDGASEWVDGQCEDARIYQRQLSANEVQTIHACRGHDGIWAGIHHRWPLTTEPPGTVAAGALTIVDTSDFKRPATALGGPLYEETRLSYRRRFT